MSVGVVTTCFNQAEFIEQCVRSVIAQTVPVEYVVVDDGSTDESPVILGSLPVRVLRVTNRGMPGARNAGLLALETDWVAFVDGDDWVEPDYVEKLLAAAGAADVVMPMLEINGLLVVADRAPTLAKLWAEDCRLFGCAMFRRRLLVRAGGFHPLMGGDCDWDFWIDALTRRARITYSEAVYHYRQHPESFTATAANRTRPASLAEMRRHHGSPPAS